MGHLLGAPSWDNYLPGLRRFNGAALGSGGNSRTGASYEFGAPADIRMVLGVDGKVAYFSSSGLARCHCRCITGQNKANNALNAAVDGGTSRDEIKA
jgi:hypothetical protein